jgi:hypothetical protein
MVENDHRGSVRRLLLAGLSRVKVRGYFLNNCLRVLQIVCPDHYHWEPRFLDGFSLREVD